MYKCCIVASPRVAESKFSPVYSLLITMYRHRTMVGGLRARKREKEKGGKGQRERKRVAKRFSARWAPLCSEVKRTVQARLSFSPIPRLHFAAVYSSPAEDDCAVLQSSFPQISIAGSSFCPLPFRIRHRSREFILQYLLRFIIKFPLSAGYHSLLFCFQVPLLIATALSHLRSIIMRLQLSTALAFCVAILIPLFLASLPVSLFIFHSYSFVFAPLPRRDLWKWAIWGKLHGYLPPETYNGRFTALVNKYFLLNNIRAREKRRHDARGPLHAAQLAGVRRETARGERCGFHLLVGKAAFLRIVNTQARGVNAVDGRWSNYDQTVPLYLIDLSRKFRET